MTRSKGIGYAAATIACVLALNICAMTLTVQTKAGAHEKPDWEDQIVPGSEQTVLDLARRIIPDIKSDAKGSKISGSDLSGIRLLDGVEETGMEVDVDAGDDLEITEPDYLWLKNGGDKLLVLFLTLEPEKLVIGLFKTSPAITLLDAATIAQDVHVTVDAGKLWSIHPQHEAFAVHFWHDNSSESFDQYAFISVVNGKLRAVADTGGFQGFTDYSPARRRVCKTALSPEFRFAPLPNRGYFDLIVTEVTLKVCHPETENWSWKTGVVYRKSVRRVWRWSGKDNKYRRSGSAGILPASSHSRP
jgi:hypothetical protein